MPAVTIDEYQPDENGVAQLIGSTVVERDDLALTVDEVAAAVRASDLPDETKATVLDAIGAGE